MPSTEWPVLTTYDADHVQRISLPTGGIGTGSIGIGGRGDLRDFELGNRPAKGFRPETCFTAIRAQSPGKPAVARLAEGPLPAELYQGAFGSPAPNHGLPRFADCTFSAAYPLGQVHLRDDAFPLEATLQAFNPMTFGDVKTSSWPAAVLRYRLTNTSNAPVHSTVAMSMSNFIGANGTEDDTGGNRNDFREQDGLAGVVMTAPDLPENAEAAGEVTVAVAGPGRTVSHRTGWADLNWGGHLLDFWDDLMDDGRLDDRDSSADRPITSLAAEVDLAPSETVDVTFVISWCFPNRRAWQPSNSHIGEYGDAIIGNAYAVEHPDSWQTAASIVDQLPELEATTVAAVRSVIETDAPAAIREAALFNLSTLRSPTLFQSAAGDYYAWEGTGDTFGSCHGTCTHVWGYEFATSQLFAPIARSFRRTQFLRATDAEGLMSFRTNLPVEEAQGWGLAAADGQMACLVHLYLDWILGGDRDQLEEMWPAARRAMEFCWVPGGWDADRDGVMEGVQHNTMDVEYYGPNPQMGSWYLAALRACEEMAVAVGDHDFAAECRRLFANGSSWLDVNLFNGSYYRHEVRPVTDPTTIARGLRHGSMGAARSDHPDLQLADGCLIDQLVGQYAASLTGLGEILDPDHVETTLRAIHQRNFRHGFLHHFNPMRSYVLGDESATVMCTYDEGKRPIRPFPYFNEVMTGFEYTAATGLLQVGATDEALEMITATRARYDGSKRNPFDEAECGHHYARALASWSAFATWNKTYYSGVEQTLLINKPEQKCFWSTGTAFGTWTPAADGDGPGTLAVIGGELALSRLTVGTRACAAAQHLAPGTSWHVSNDELVDAEARR